MKSIKDGKNPFSEVIDNKLLSQDWVKPISSVVIKKNNFNEKRKEEHP